MDLENLNKTQIILLTLLVSFVTSIATGIATVSLMEKAPTDVTRVISRIVEKPIETIVPNSKTETVVKERTVVVSEGQQIADAVKKISPSIVRLYTIAGRNDEKTFKGMGVIISAEGIVVADSRIVNKKDDYVAVMADGTTLTATPSDTQTEQGFFKLTPASTGTIFAPATFAPFDTLVLGQTVVAITGETATRIAPGVIAELTPSTPDNAARLRATIDASSILLGAPLVTVSGSIIGMPQDVGSQIFLSLRDSASQ